MAKRKEVRGEEDVKRKLLEETLKRVQKAYGPGAVMKLDEQSALRIDAIPTGSLALDAAIGVGGYPRGRIVEIYGAESSGKTTLALMAIAEAQKLGGTALFIDAEHAFNEPYAQALGINTKENFLVSQPDYGEQALDIASQFIRTGAVDIVVIDSVAALVPKAELEGTIEDQQMGLQARLMSKALRMLAAEVSKTNAVVIFINQIREKIGVMFGNPETTPGGRALKFFASVRLEVRRGESIRDKDNRIIGHMLKIKVVKNKVAPPYREALVPLIYGKGVDRVGEVFDIAVSHGIIKKSGSWYSYEGTQLGQGRERALETLRENEDLYAEIEGKVLEVLGLKKEEKQQEEGGER
ncbi:MAG: recombinase RecA [Thermotogae bacterium]|nr:recombinase RecA [Thermotogota bacterium]